MTEEEVKEKLLRTPSGKFEFRSGFLEQHADYIERETGRPRRSRRADPVGGSRAYGR
jgi:thiosulfate reductase / polysulfide reductase chain A